MKRKKGDQEELIILSGRHRPVELSIITATLIISAIDLLDGHDVSTAGIIKQLFPSYTWAWNVVLVLGAVIALAGAMWVKLVEALLAERVGLLILATSFLAYGVGIMFARNPASFSAWYFACIGIGMFVRSWQITRDLHHLEQALKKTTPPPTLIVSDGPITDPNLPKVVIIKPEEEDR